MTPSVFIGWCLCAVWIACIFAFPCMLQHDRNVVSFLACMSGKWAEDRCFCLKFDGMECSLNVEIRSGFNRIPLSTFKPSSLLCFLIFFSIFLIYRPCLVSFLAEPRCPPAALGGRPLTAQSPHRRARAPGAQARLPCVWEP